MKEPIYGFPCVADPRDFYPDEESCKPEELESHRKDVELAKQGKYFDNSDRFCNGVLLKTPWGIGINMVGEEKPYEQYKEVYE